MADLGVFRRPAGGLQDRHILPDRARERPAPGIISKKFGKIFLEGRQGLGAEKSGTPRVSAFKNLQT
jgi:hypothetical protein